MKQARLHGKDLSITRCALRLAFDSPLDICSPNERSENNKSFGTWFNCNNPRKCHTSRRGCLIDCIAVVVRDSKAFWLSSGNWTSSNQPNHEIAVDETTWNLLLEHNREWNVVIENKNLSKQFSKYIEYDLANAKLDAANESASIPESCRLYQNAWSIKDLFALSQCLTDRCDFSDCLNGESYLNVHHPHTAAQGGKAAWPRVCD